MTLTLKHTQKDSISKFVKPSQPNRIINTGIAPKDETAFHC